MTFCILLTVHLFSDFLFQSSIFSEKKKREWQGLGLHCLTYFCIFEIAFSLMFNFKKAFLPAFILSIFHFFALCLKNKLEKKFHKSRAILFFFVANQLLHIAILFTVYHFFKLEIYHSDIYKYWQSYQNSNNIVAYIFLIVLLLEPTASFIRKILALISTRKSDRGSVAELKAGSMIGKLERMIIAILLLNNQYGAIGLVLTAKSIARFKQMENRNFAEKYLVGTLTSVFIALVATIIIKNFL